MIVPCDDIMRDNYYIYICVWHFQVEYQSRGAKLLHWFKLYIHDFLRTQFSNWKCQTIRVPTYTMVLPSCGINLWTDNLDGEQMTLTAFITHFYKNKDSILDVLPQQWASYSLCYYTPTLYIETSFFILF